MGKGEEERNLNLIPPFTSPKTYSFPSFSPNLKLWWRQLKISEELKLWSHRSSFNLSLPSNHHKNLTSSSTPLLIHPSSTTTSPTKPQTNTNKKKKSYYCYYCVSQSPILPSTIGHHPVRLSSMHQTAGYVFRPPRMLPGSTCFNPNQRVAAGCPCFNPEQPKKRTEGDCCCNALCLVKE